MTAIRMRGPWRELAPGPVAAVGAQLGVYELADRHGTVTLIGYAGGRSRFGLRGEVAAHLEREDATGFRVEATSAYLSRYRELLMVHFADHGALPAGNGEDPARIGRLSPASPGPGPPWT